MEMETKHGISEIQNNETHPEHLNGLVNTVDRFGIAGLNKGQPVFQRVAMEYVDKQSV